MIKGKKKNKGGRKEGKKQRKNGKREKKIEKIMTFVKKNGEIRKLFSVKSCFLKKLIEIIQKLTEASQKSTETLRKIDLKRQQSVPYVMI